MFVYSSELFEHFSTLSSVVSGPLAMVRPPIICSSAGVSPPISVALRDVPGGNLNLQFGDGPLVRLLVTFTDK